MQIPETMTAKQVVCNMYDGLQEHFIFDNPKDFKWVMSPDVFSELYGELIEKRELIVRSSQADIELLYGIPYEIDFNKKNYITLYKNIEEDVFI